jgi:hypothetical protein
MARGQKAGRQAHGIRDTSWIWLVGHQVVLFVADEYELRLIP